MSSFLSYEQKKVVLNSFISEQFNSCPLIWMFISIRSYRKISKLHNRSLQLCHNDYTSTYDELFSKHGLQYSHKKYSVINDRDFQTYKRSISPIMNKMLRNIPYTIRNPRDLDIQLQKLCIVDLKLWQKN